MFRTLACGVALSAALMSAPAVAADLPMEPAPAVVAVPSFTWTGFYLGVQAGYGWGRSSNTPLDPKGAIVGGYAGYNYQFDNSPLVIGVETDFNWSDMDDSLSFVAGGAAAFRGRFRQDVKWVGATRGRIGYAFDRVLVYGAAGVAYARREFRVTVRGGSASDSKTAVGWTVGGGVEAAVTDNVLVRAEYRYSDYGTDRFNLGGGFGGKSDLKEHRVMAGVAYKF